MSKIRKSIRKRFYIPFTVRQVKAVNFQIYSQRERNQITDPTPGIMLFNSTFQSLQIYEKDGWKTLKRGLLGN